MNSEPDNDGATIPPQDGQADFPIVGVGASAGGVEALQAFLSALSPDTVAALVVILHLPADASSQLAELLDASCPLPVRPIVNGAELRAGTVSVLPPGQSVELQNDHLRLRPRPKGVAWRPIDRFFQSLPLAAGERAVAVVLSGTGDDGSVALGAIKQAGGLVVAQQPDEAQCRAMPQQAIATNQVDQVGTCAELAAAISSWAQRLPRVTQLAQLEQDDVDRALARVQEHTGQDFQHYKRGTMERRILRRCSMRACEHMADYLALLERESLEVEHLAKDLLIGVTAFFRDSAVWQHLADTVVPDLLRRGEPDQPLRAWVAGCASGEEAYTLAMILSEALETRELYRPVQIFATDTDQKACNGARRGLFPAAAVSGVGQLRLAQHFSRENGSYRIANGIRDMITFAQHNLLRDPPFSQLDLITCRNVLIYLDAQAQEQVLGRFHFALRRDGILLLGGSETAQRQETLFDSIDDNLRCYQRRETPSPSTAFSSRLRQPPRQLPMPQDSVSTQHQSNQAHHALAQDLAQHHFAPAFVLVDERHQVRYYSGAMGDFLERPVGVPNDDILTICHPTLRPRLTAALAHTAHSDECTVLHYAPDGQVPVEVTVQSVIGINDEQLHMISFRRRTGGTGHAATEAVAKGELAAEQALHALDQELRATREELSSSIEELETANEELKASNEEVRSMYEELQSTNEELQSSHEQREGTNKELHALNQRLRRNLAELAEANDLLGNLLSSTNLPTVFLDRNLRIQRFTPTAGRLMRLIPSDVGRPFDDMADRISGGHMLVDARRVLDSLIPTQREVRAEDGTWFNLRIHPFRTSEDRIDGVVITLADITAQKRVETQWRESEQRYRSIFDNAAVGIVHLDGQGRIRTANTTVSSIMQLPQHLLIDRCLSNLFPPEAGQRLAAVLAAVVNDAASVIELPLRVEDGTRHLRCTCSRAAAGEPDLIVIIEDISDRRQIEDRLHRRSRDLERSNEDLSHFAAMASHDLQAPLRRIGLSLDLITQLEDLSPAQRREHFDSAKQAAQRMRSMITELLQYARTELDARPLTRCDSRQVVEQVLSGLDASIAERRATVVLGDLPVVLTPQRLLTQLFQNLIDNAIKHGHDGVPPHITISAQRDHATWLFRIADNGRGIPLEQRQRIFDLFDRSGAGDTDGSGIGLAICRKGIERLGGRIWVEDQTGPGTTIAFTIPDVPKEESS